MILVVSFLGLELKLKQKIDKLREEIPKGAQCFEKICKNEDIALVLEFNVGIHDQSHTAWDQSIFN